jgi:PPOX class probable F420-dependent enzyme
MAAKLDETAKAIIAGKNYAHVAIPREDGTVHTVIVWADLDGDNVTLNSAEGRGWPANLRKAGTATITVMADNNPYEWVSLTGRVITDTHEGADEQIDAMAIKYTGRDYSPNRRPGEQRVRFVLEPERVYHHTRP